MKPSLGRIRASLAEPAEHYPAELIALINTNIHPPVPLTAADVYIRAMYVVSDAVNSYGGAFPADEHARLANLLIDAPVMIGHRKDKLPVGRTFHTRCVTHQGRPWVKAYFYWLRSSEHGEELKENIDGGVYKECSISFTFNLPECSVCGRDIRTCEHEPMQQYRLHGKDTACHFNYRKIDRVLETSLVYRGAVPGTSVSKDLSVANEAGGFSNGRILTTLEQLDANQEYVIIPRYQGVSVTLQANDGQPTMIRDDGPLIDVEPTSLTSEQIAIDAPLAGLLVGYRGKSRCPLSQLERHLSGISAGVGHLTLHLLPHQTSAATSDDASTDLRIQTMPFRVAKPRDLKAAASEITTALGVEIYPLGELPTADNCWQSHPDRLKDEPSALLYCQDRHAVIVINDGGQIQTLSFGGFDRDALMTGRCFVAEETAHPPSDDFDVVDRGEVTAVKNGLLVIRLSSILNLVVRSARLGGQTVRLVQAANADRLRSIATKSSSNHQPLPLVHARH